MRVKDVMRREFVTVSPEASLAEIIAKFYPLDGDWAPVCEGSQLVGMIRYDDIASRAAKNGRAAATRARDLLSEEICYCFETTRLSEAISLMDENHVGNLPVVNAMGELVGILTREDIPDSRLIVGD
jgi:predicted transcriptional regulator